MKIKLLIFLSLFWGQNVLSHSKKIKNLKNELLGNFVFKKTILLETYTEPEKIIDTENKELENIPVIDIMILVLAVMFIFYFIIIRFINKREIKNIKAPTQHGKYLNRLIEKEKLKQESLKEELAFKNKQLTSYAFSFEQKDKTINKIFNIVKDLEKESSFFKENQKIQELVKIEKENLIIDKEWGRFRTFFEETQSDFYTKLKKRHKKLTTNDLKLCSLTRLNLNIKEAANILNISPGSVKTARYRLRKKLNLNSEDTLIDYLT